MDLAPALEANRQSLRGTIQKISELAQSARPGLLGLLKEQLVSPELHKLFPAGAAGIISSYQTFILFVTHTLQAPNTKLMDCIFTLVRTL